MLPTSAGGYAKDVLALNRVLEMLKVLLMVLLQPPFLLYLFLQKLKLLRLMLAISKGLDLELLVLIFIILGCEERERR